MGLGLIPVWIAVGELVARSVLSAIGEPYAAEQVRQGLLDLQSAVVERVPGFETGSGSRSKRGATLGVHPYVGWDSLGDQMGRETERYTQGEYDETFEVLIIGGSVSALTASQGAETLLELLRADPRLSSERVIILNHGRGSYKQPQMTLKTAFLLSLGYRPDVVLLIDGFNEVALGMDNLSLGAHPLYPHWGMFGPLVAGTPYDPERVQSVAEMLDVEAQILAEIDRALRWRLCESAVLGRWVRSRTRALRAHWTDLQNEIVLSLGAQASERHPAQGRGYPEDPELSMDMVAASWVESSIQLDAICKARGIQFLHVLQPTLHDAGSKPLTAGEIETSGTKPSWIQGVQMGYPRLRAAAPQIAAAGVAFLDASDTFKDLKEPTYYDCCHFRGPGMELFAERIARKLLEAPLDPRRARLAPQGFSTSEPALPGPTGSESSTPLASSANASTAQ